MVQYVIAYICPPEGVEANVFPGTLAVTLTCVATRRVIVRYVDAGGS